MSHALSRISDFFNRLNKDSLFLVDEFYDPAVRYISPLGEFSTRDDIKEYYASLYRYVIAIHFDFMEQMERDGTCLAVWKMNLRSQMNGGRLIIVDGTSHIKFGGKEGKAIYQKDIYDMGNFFYEAIPVLRHVIHFIKRKIYLPAARSLPEQDI